ncbi:MAG: hypothetical protein JO206_03140 [Solirubrobacterales bacterium]|nr:hypothetical protein [Solirubrobacterales bacterium]MBV9471937.1 hypothetical protein [Solirubrobacterales bacterium]
MELIPAIRDRLAQVDGRSGGPLASGFRAALWRAQHQAARAEHTVDDLRGYCLEALQGWRVLDERDENDYLRGYRQGFQAVLSDIRRAETSRFRY